MSKERFCLDSVRADLLEGTSSWTPRKTWVVTPWGWRKQGLSWNLSHRSSFAVLSPQRVYSTDRQRLDVCSLHKTFQVSWVWKKKQTCGYLLESWLSSSAENSRNCQPWRCSGTFHRERRINQSTSSASQHVSSCLLRHIFLHTLHRPHTHTSFHPYT